MVTRIAFTARIRPHEHERLKQRFSARPPFDPELAGFDHHAVFLGEEDVVFVFEGDDPLPAVRALAAQPGLLTDVLKMAGAVKAPHYLEEVYSWSRRPVPIERTAGARKAGGAAVS